MVYPEERALLAEVARDAYRRHKRELERMKDEGRALIQQPDFLWNEIVGAFSTWGGSSGWDRLTADPENMSRLAYGALAQLNPAERHGQIRDALRRAGIRWPNRKARLLAKCFERIAAIGGPRRATRVLLEQEGTQAKVRFLMSLPGIGPKYARNIMMVSYHEDFRNTIAVDSRIKEIPKRLGLSFSDYDEAESFYQSVAGDAGVSGWELDRLMYNYAEEFLDALTGEEGEQYQESPRTRQGPCARHRDL